MERNCNLTSKIAIVISLFMRIYNSPYVKTKLLNKKTKRHLHQPKLTSSISIQFLETNYLSNDASERQSFQSLSTTYVVSSSDSLHVRIKHVEL